MKNLIPIIVLSSFLLSHCKVVKYTPEKLPARQIIFGDGGGFAGIETSYTMLENGQIFKQVGASSAYEELRSIKSKEAKALFEKVASLQLYKMDIEKPGNLYYFMQEVNEAIDSRVTWGAGDYLPPKNLVSTFKEMDLLAKSREVVKEGIKAVAEKKKEEKEDKKKTDW